MDDLQLYYLFNSISVISGRQADDNEMLCAMEPRLCHLKGGLNRKPLDQ